jgi:endonuclease-3
MPKAPAGGKSAPAPSKSPADTRRIMAKLATQHPNADTELHFTTPYELLVATILSAQCTDERVNQVTPALFKRYPDARALARASTDELEPQIQSTGFFRAKSRALAGMAAACVERHGGEVPKTMAELVELPGVGRKTANVVLGHALGVPGLPVDRHVLRVSNRIGIARSDDPEIVEQQLCAAMPPADWTRTSDTLILHGRRICKPRPLCDRCVVRDDCDYYRTLLGATPTARGKRAPSKAASGSSVEKPRTTKPRGTGPGGGPHQSRESETSGEKRERRRREGKVALAGPTGVALKAERPSKSRSGEAARAGRDGGRAGVVLKADSPSKARVAKARGQGVTVGPTGVALKAERPSKSPSGEAARTGRGGGAPRQSNK